MIEVKIKARSQRKWSTMDFYLRGRHAYISRYKAADWQVKAGTPRLQYSVWTGDGELLLDTSKLDEAVEMLAQYDDYRDGIIYTGSEWGAK